MSRRPKQNQSEAVFERKPVPITGMPEALDYVSPFQQAEFEERLLDMKVEEFPIAMLMSYVAQKWYGCGLFFCGSMGYHGFVDYCREVTDEMILHDNVFSGATSEPGCWNQKCSILGIDWKHEELCMGPRTVSFRGMTIRQFSDLLSSDKARPYLIPGTDLGIIEHSPHWESMYGECMAPLGKYTIPRTYFYQVQNMCDVSYCNLGFVMDLYRPWYLLREEYDIIKRKQADNEENVRKIGQTGLSGKKRDDKVAVLRNYKKQSMARQTGMFVVSHLRTGKDMENMHISVSRVDGVRIVKNEQAWKQIKKSGPWLTRTMYRTAEYPSGRKYMQEITDQDVVEIRFHTVQFGFGDSTAYQSVEYCPIDSWQPYDDPDWMRLASMPTEMPFNRPNKFRSQIDKFTCTGEVLSQIIPKLEGFAPKDTIDGKFAKFISQLETIKGTPKKQQPTVHKSDVSCWFRETFEPYLFMREDDNGKPMVMLALRRGFLNEECKKLVTYTREEVHAEVERLKKKYLGKWVISKHGYMRIDFIYPFEVMRDVYINSYKDSIGDNYVLPSIMVKGPSIDMNDWRPKTDDDDCISLEYEGKPLDGMIKRINLMSVIKYDDIVEQAKKAMSSKPKKLAQCYSRFVKGMKELIAGKAPEYKQSLPSSGIR